MAEEAPAQPGLALVAGRLRSVNRRIGRSVALLTVLMVIIMAVIVAQRYLFDSGSIRLQESIVFLHAAVFMLAMAYTLDAGAHVRVDVFYGSMQPRNKAFVDIAGTLLLLMPFCLFLVWSSWDYVTTSWAIRESSPETGGLPFPFPALMKSFIPAAGFMLLLQGIVMALESVLVLRAQTVQPKSTES